MSVRNKNSSVPSARTIWKQNKNKPGNNLIFFPELRHQDLVEPTHLILYGQLQKKFTKQLVRKRTYPTEMLWVELMIYFQPEREKNRVEAGAEMSRPVIADLL